MSAEAAGIDLAEFISRFVPLVKEGNEARSRCPFCDSGDERSLRVGADSWKTYCCNSDDRSGGDAPGFYACWTDSTREEAIAHLGNGAGLPDAKPIEQRPLRKLPFWGCHMLEKLPEKAVWIHELSGAVLVWRELVPERVHLGIIANRTWDDLAIVAGRRCVLVPENNPAGRVLMQRLAAALYHVGHKQVMCLELGIDPEFGTRALPPPGATSEERIAWAKARSRPYPKPGEEIEHAAPQDNKAEADYRNFAITGHTARSSASLPNTSGPAGATPASPDTRIAAPPPGAQPGPTPSERAYAYTEQAKAEVLAGMVYRKASTVTLRATDWLWPGKIPLGEICVIQGDPGLGKSQITASLAAVITKGGQWPLTRERCTLGSVIILSAEDSMAKTIVPRLAAAGADLERVTILQAIKLDAPSHGTRGFSLLADMLALEALLNEEDNPMAVIVDPISAYQDTVGAAAKTHDSHKNVDVRSLLRPVSELVDRRNITMILINHLTKGSGRAITRGQGNMAFVAGPRAVWQVSKDKDDPRKRLFLPVKNNLADDSEGTGLSFTVEGMELGNDAQGKPINTSRILWNDEKVTITADEAAGYDSLSQDERGSVNEAQEFLKEALAECRLKAKDVERQAKDAGHNMTTLGRAKRALGVISEKEGFGATTVWYWKLKPEEPRAESSNWVKDD